MPTPRPLSALAAGCCALLAACSTTHRPPPGAAAPPHPAYSDTGFRETLARHVSPDGRVDYAALSRNPAPLARYYRQVAATSPDSHPTLFPTRDDALAYWINAYNATAIWNVLAHYPVDSVLDVAPPKIGFFLNQRFEYGGTTTSLYFLENGVIRKRFPDPRTHFALNCASAGCPQLPRTPFTGGALDAELDRETRAFINSPTYVRPHAPTRTLHLSSIFKWYRDDFTTWLERHRPKLAPTLASYVRLYASPELRLQLDALGPSPEIAFLPYDWSLNAQAARPAPPRPPAPAPQTGPPPASASPR